MKSSLFAVLATCLATVAPAGGGDAFALTNARIYTENQNRPWATALVVRGDRIVYVGDAGTPEWGQAIAPKMPIYDLKQRLVLPGFIDAHTHPGLTAIYGPGNPMIDITAVMPTGNRTETLRWLWRYAKAHQNSKIVSLFAWEVATYFPDGPNKRDLDAIWPTTPVVLMDNSGHSVWVNSAMLKLLGVDAHTPDLSPDISVYVRDRNGEPAGWIKEFAAARKLMPLMMPPREKFTARLNKYLAYLSSHGVTTLFDAGNVGLEDSVYRELAEFDRAGKLPIRYFGSYHIWDPAQIERAVAEVKRLRATYGGSHLRFDTVKIHFDGVFEILTAAMLEPYAIDPTKRGGVLFDRERLARFIEELEAEHINLHLHVVGDRATREALDAIDESARRLGHRPEIEITLSHLQIVDPNDFGRFRQPHLHANFTPHWFGGTQFGSAGLVTLGPERAARDELVGSMWRAGADVTFSSDVTSADEIPRTNPFVGLEMAMTRRDYEGGADLYKRPPMPEEQLTLEQSLAAYTLNGARQLGIANETGSLEAGKKADFLVVSRDPFKVPVHRIHDARIDAVVLEGRVTAGGLR